MNKYKIAVLDDYQNVALESADWSVLRDRADIAVFQNHLADPDALIERLLHSSYVTGTELFVDGGVAQN
jgi:NAD(P)-dependent dehydrogenase (short-subunit alcohol dehydrogenase family)